LKTVAVVVAFERFQRWIILSDRRSIPLCRTPLFASWEGIGIYGDFYIPASIYNGLAGAGKS
jgi:hypothetical protein